MANDYVNQIQANVNGIKSQINTTLKYLYEPKPIVSHDVWLTSKETNYINTINNLIKQYKTIVETMKTNFWGIDYKTNFVNEFNKFIVGTNNQYNYFKKGYESFFSGTFGKINEQMWNELLKDQVIHSTRIQNVAYQLENKNYLSVMSVGYFQLHYSMYALAKDSYTTIDKFNKYKETYYTVSRFFNIDVLCAQIYYYHQLNKNKLILDSIDEYFNNNIKKTQKDLNILSSALEWMKNEVGLKKVLEYMQAKGFSLSVDRKTRLSQLSHVKENNSFDISSANKQINDSIKIMRTNIKNEFIYLTDEPISYSVYLNSLYKDSSPLYKYGPVDWVKNSLDFIKKENESVHTNLRDRLTNDEIKRLELLWANYYTFKNNNLKREYPLLYLENKGFNENYMHEIMLADSTNILKKIEHINNILDSEVDEYKWNQIWKYDVCELMKHAWNIALNSNSNNYKEFGSQFIYVQNLFYRLTRYFNIHMYLAELQQDICLYGKDTIQYKLNTYLKNENIEKSKKDLNVLATFLEYHDLMNEEKMILKTILDSGMELDVYKAKRLNYLENYKEDGPKKLEVENKSQLHFDVSSIEWRENDVNEFFKQLDLNKQVLDYSLAIFLEDQDIILGKGIKLANIDIICEQINHHLDDEFDGEVIAKCMDASILSENIKEELEGIYIDIEDCPTMKLFVNLMKVGKKLNIRFYTLYTPTDNDINNQRNECMALNKKISPSMSVWEKSVKDTVLLSLQHVLNSNMTSETNKIINDEF